MAADVVGCACCCRRRRRRSLDRYRRWEEDGGYWRAIAPAIGFDYERVVFCFVCAQLLSVGSEGELQAAVAH